MKFFFEPEYSFSHLFPNNLFTNNLFPNNLFVIEDPAEYCCNAALKKIYNRAYLTRIVICKKIKFVNNCQPIYQTNSVVSTDNAASPVTCNSNKPN